jgi:hypothetical protein
MLADSWHVTCSVENDHRAATEEEKKTQMGNTLWTEFGSNDVYLVLRLAEACQWTR